MSFGRVRSLKGGHTRTTIIFTLLILDYLVLNYLDPYVLVLFTHYTRLERNLSGLLPRTPVVGRRQQSELIEVALDME